MTARRRGVHSDPAQGSGRATGALECPQPTRAGASFGVSRPFGFLGSEPLSVSSEERREDEMPRLQRTTFKTSRAAQYVEARALTAMTGQGEGKFADVVAKELFDNGLDACETSGVAPEITLAVEEQFSGGVLITVSDNASGIPQDTMHGALNFDVLVSDKAAYRSPTRGAQGNALKTIFGIPHALGSLEPIVVDAKGTRHEARVWKEP